MIPCCEKNLTFKCWSSRFSLMPKLKISWTLTLSPKFKYIYVTTSLPFAIKYCKSLVPLVLGHIFFWKSRSSLRNVHNKIVENECDKFIAALYFKRRRHLSVLSRQSESINFTLDHTQYIWSHNEGTMLVIYELATFMVIGLSSFFLYLCVNSPNF